MVGVSEQSRVLSFEDARHEVEQRAASVRLGGVEFIPLGDSAGRVLAKPITADRDYPPFPRAMRDGYAVRAADLAQLPATLEVIGEIKAGAEPKDVPAHVGPGQAVGDHDGRARAPWGRRGRDGRIHIA